MLTGKGFFFILSLTVLSLNCKFGERDFGSCTFPEDSKYIGGSGDTGASGDVKRPAGPFQYNQELFRIRKPGRN